MIIEEQERVSSKHVVVPVFYDVEPSDVRNQTGSFGKAFGDLIEKETDHEKVKAWRVSLRKAGSFTGMILANGPEAEFISDIVKDIEKKLNKKLLYMGEKPVGIKYDVDEIEAWLQDPSPNEVILLINGMGGIGKTTISKCIYNSNFREYDGSCFLANINETSNQPNGLLRLQRQVLSTILRNGKEETIWNVDEGTIKIRDAICNKKILFILDDVTKAKQINALLGPHWFYPGSKVIITTRHKWLSNVFKVHPKVHTVRELGDGNSIEPFSLYAFHQDHPIEPYIVQSKLVVHHCGGLPLALKVLGSSLHGKTVDVWEDAIRKLEAIPNPEIQKILQVSYETLEDEKDKDLFLHVACFFGGEDKDYIVKILAQCDLFPVVGIENLTDRCLLYIEDGRVRMHQLIKEMGRDVVRQESPKDPGKQSRLWRHEDSFNVLKDNVGTGKVEGLRLDMQRIKEANLTSIVKMDNERKSSYKDFLGRTKHANEANFNIGALGKMKNLMLLQLDYVTFSGRYKMLPEKLRLLRWHGFSLKSIPGDIPLEKLVVLDLRYSKLKQVWDGFKLIGSLKILNLSYSVELIKTPDFGGLPGLESLILKGCLSLTQVCESIWYLEELALLDVSDCRRLRDIPCLPRSLVSLKMSGCPNLGVLERVQFLVSSSLPSLLVNVDISDCNLFDDSFPNDWSNLVSLERLIVDGNNITSLPKCIQSLPTLLELDVCFCPQLQSIEGIPKSVLLLFSYNNASLEKVNHAQNPSSICSTLKCDKLCEVEGWAKLRSVESISHQEMGFEKQKVLYEFPVFNLYNITWELPRSYFRYIERGSRILFKVPSHFNNSRISGLVVFLMLNQSGWLNIEVNNKTKALVWNYISVEIAAMRERKTWLSFWKCGNLLENGDEIVVRISCAHEGKSHDNECKGVKECGINFLYEDDEVLEDNEECDGERKVVCHVDQTSWKDRLLEKLENMSL